MVLYGYQDFVNTKPFMMSPVISLFLSSKSNLHSYCQSLCLQFYKWIKLFAICGCHEHLQNAFLPSIEIIVLYSLYCLFSYVLYSLSKFLNIKTAFFYKNKSCFVRMNNYFKVLLNSTKVSF